MINYAKPKRCRPDSALKALQEQRAKQKQKLAHPDDTARYNMSEEAHHSTVILFQEEKEGDKNVGKYSYNSDVSRR